jgi:ribA/ribD-fused uncharacterized protein
MGSRPGQLTRFSVKDAPGAAFLGPMKIEFYSVAHDYGELSNFARYPITVEGKRYPTSEHYFQAMKFAGKGYAEEIRRARTPGRAARLGRTRGKGLRREWESVKVEVMLTALRAKFTQHPELAELLLGTGEATLVEHTTRDAYWGDGGDGSGKNWLGRLLMRVRDELRSGELRGSG